MGVLCRQALDAFARVDPERKVRLTSDGDLSGDWDVTAASREAVGGLLANAARFASRGSWVTIAVDGHAADEVKVTVHGDGTPIDVETLQTIFDPVARVESENATYAGLGLGLFIVRKVVDAHGGHVSVEASAQDGHDLHDGAAAARVARPPLSAYAAIASAARHQAFGLGQLRLRGPHCRENPQTRE